MRELEFGEAGAGKRARPGEDRIPGKVPAREGDSRSVVQAGGPSVRALDRPPGSELRTGSGLLGRFAVDSARALLPGWLGELKRGPDEADPEGWLALDGVGDG